MIEPAFDPFLQGFGGAQATIGLAVHQHQVAGVGDELKGGLNRSASSLGQPLQNGLRCSSTSRSPVAKGGGGLLEGLQGLTCIGPIQAAEVEAAPAGVDNLAD